MNLLNVCSLAALLSFTACSSAQEEKQEDTSSSVGVDAAPIEGAKVYFDGTEESLMDNWEYWEGPGFMAQMPIKWMLVGDEQSGGKVLNSNDPTSKGGKYGSADIVTKDKFKDFRAHVEFLIAAPGGNSGVYLQNRYEIQVLDGDSTNHGMAAVINEKAAPYKVYAGLGKWNAYDIQFRAARFDSTGTLTEKPLVTVYFNGQKIHENVSIGKVYGGPNSGLDGGNDDGNGITDTPGGLKLQAEGHDVLYRNVWIKALDIEEPNTDF